MPSLFAPRSLRRTYDALQFDAASQQAVADVAAKEAAAAQPIALPSLASLTPWDTGGDTPAAVGASGGQPGASGEFALPVRDDYARTERTPALTLPSLASLTPWEPSTTSAQGEPSGAFADTSGRGIQLGTVPLDTSSPDAFLQTATAKARNAATRAGLPAWAGDIAAGIAANETGYGRAVAGNNFFGIKGSNPRTGANTGPVGTWEVVNGQRQDIQDTFRAYDDPEESFADFFQFLKDNPRYAGALRAQDPESFIRDIHAAGYATDPAWSDKVLRIAGTAGGLAGGAAPTTPVRDRYAMAPEGIATQAPQKAGAAASGDLLAAARSQIGKPYVWGGKDPGSSFDCSGFVSWVYGGKVPSFTDAIADATERVDPTQARPGDIVLFRYDDPSQPGVRYPHTGILSGSGTIIDASYGRGITERPLPNLGTVEFRRVPGANPARAVATAEVVHDQTGGQESANPLQQLADATTGAFKGVGDLFNQAGQAAGQMAQDTGEAIGGLAGQIGSTIAGPRQRQSQAEYEAQNPPVGETFGNAPAPPVDRPAFEVPPDAEAEQAGLTPSDRTLIATVERAAQQAMDNPAITEMIPATAGPLGAQQLAYQMLRAVNPDLAEKYRAANRLGMALVTGQLQADVFNEQLPAGLRRERVGVDIGPLGRVGIADLAPGLLPGKAGIAVGGAPIPLPAVREGAAAVARHLPNPVRAAVGALGELAQATRRMGRMGQAPAIVGDTGDMPRPNIPRDASDNLGRYRIYGDAVDVNGNWKRLQELPDDAYVALYHATSRENAEKIMEGGYSAKQSAFTNTPPDYVYLGDKGGLGTYIGYQGRGDPVYVVFKVRKSALEPDAGSDWKSHARLYRDDLKRWGIDPNHPTAVDTYAQINQVRAHVSEAEPIGIWDYKTDEFTPRPISGGADPALAAEAARLTTGRRGRLPEGPALVGRDSVRTVEEAAALPPPGEGSSRYYHGTGSEYATPEGAKFDPNGLFGPAYYLTSDARVAGSYQEVRGNMAQSHAENEAWKNLSWDDARDLLQRVRDGLPTDTWVAQNARKLLDSEIADIRNAQADPRELPWRYVQTAWNGIPLAKSDFQAIFDGARLDKIAELTAGVAQPNLRAVDVPRGLRLLDAEAVRPDDVRAMVDSIERVSGGGPAPDAMIDRRTQDVLNDMQSGQRDWYHALAYRWDEREVNQGLAALGYDGIRYSGGKRIPMMDQAGAPIEHEALAIFPEALPKLRNAVSGLPGGLVEGAGTPGQPGSQLARRAAIGAVQGGVSAGYEASQEEGATPQSVAAGALKGAVVGGLRGAAMARPGAAGRMVMRAVEGLGDEERLPLGPKDVPVRAVAETARRIETVPVSRVQLDPARFQYKVQEVDPRTGVSAKLASARRWNPDLASVMYGWEDEAGNLFVVNGHHRVELAHRTAPSVDVNMQIDRAADGVTWQQARIKGALINIAEGQGSAVDAAKLLRDSGLTADDLAAVGVPIKGKLARDGAALAQLDDGLFQRVTVGQLDQQAAVVIGENLPGDIANQRAVAQMIEGRALRPSELRALIDEAKAGGSVSVEQQTLFGTDVREQSTLIERARLRAFVLDKLAQDKRLFGYVARPERAEALRRGENVINVEASGKIAQEAGQAEEYFRALVNAPGPVNRALQDGAERLLRGEKLGDVRTEVYDAVRDAIIAERQPGAAARPAPADLGGPARALPGAAESGAAGGAEPTAAPGTRNAEGFLEPIQQTGPDLFGETVEPAPRAPEPAPAAPPQQPPTGAQPPREPREPLRFPVGGQAELPGTPPRAKPTKVEAALDGGTLATERTLTTDELLATVGRREGVTGAAVTAEGAARQGSIPDELRARLPNLDKIDAPPEVVAGLARTAAENPGLIDAYRRGVITHRELIDDLAPRLGMTADDFLKSKPGRAFNETELLVLRAAVVDKQARLGDLADSIAARGGVGALSDADRAAAIAQLTDAARLQAVARGAAATAGRTLNQQKIAIDRAMAAALTGSNERRAAEAAADVARSKLDRARTPSERQVAQREIAAAEKRQQLAERQAQRVAERQQQQARKVLDGLGGQTITDRLLKDFLAVQASGDPLAAAQFLRHLAQPTPWERLGIWRYASMLSATSTHLTNAFSNVVRALQNVGTIPASAGLDAARARITGGERTRYLGEMGPYVGGWLEGTQAGLADALTALKTGINPQQASKLDVSPGFASGNGLVDAVVEGPLRFLTAADLVFRGGAAGGAARQAAFRRAMREGAPDVAGRTDEIVRNLADFPDLLDEVEKAAAASVFQEKRAVSGALLALRNNPKIPESARAAISFVVPFIRTPYNIAAQGMGMTPAGLVGVVDAAKRGQTGEATDRAARALFGTAVMGAAGVYAAQGYLTANYPSEAAERSTLPPGWQPWSVRLPDGKGGATYVSFANLGPLGVPLALGTIGGQAFKKGGGLTGADYAAMATGVGKFMIDMPFLQGLSALVNALDDPQRHAENFTEGFATQLAPFGAMQRQIQRAVGMAPRDPHGAIEALLAINLPTAGLVPPRTDVLGRPQQPGQTGAAAFVSPLRYDTERDVPVIKAFRDAGVSIPAPPKQLPYPGLPGAKVPLTREEQAAYKAAFGEALQRGYGTARLSPNELEMLRSQAREQAQMAILFKIPPAELQRRMQATD